MGHTDVLARVLAIVALVIATGSLLLGWRTYRRGGALVKVTARKHSGKAVMYANGPIYGDVVEVTVSNRGLASVQVTGILFEVHGKEGARETDAGGPTLPMPLDGFHRETWEASMSALLGLAGVSGAAVARVRAGVELGNDRKRFSRRWLNLSEADLSK